MRMQWSQIKTLLILSFLILNGYLLVQFLEKREQADLGTLDHQQSSIEEQLKSEAIKVNELPEERYEESYISVKPQLFKKKDLEEVNNLVKQDLVTINKSQIMSELEKPIEVKRNKDQKYFETLIEDMVLYAEDYTFWNWDKEKNILIYFQEKEGRTIYYNQNGLLLLFLNEKNEVTFYTQTYLGKTESQEEKRELITPLTAIEILYN